MLEPLPPRRPSSTRERGGASVTCLPRDIELPAPKGRGPGTGAAAALATVARSSAPLVKHRAVGLMVERDGKASAVVRRDEKCQDVWCENLKEAPYM